MASGSFYNYPVKNFGVYCEWSSTVDANNNQSTVVLKTYISYYTLSVAGGTWTTSVNGVSKTFTSPAISVSSASAWSKKLLNTRTETVKHNSDGKKQITLSASYPFNGTYSGTSIGTITASKTVDLDNISTACTPPTTFAASPNNFEDSVTLMWVGASGGISNPIESYLIRYRTSSDNSTWSGWADLTTVKTTGSYSMSIDVSSKVSRGYYVQFGIRSQPSNTAYASSWKYSDAIRRKPYTKCTAPTTIAISPSGTFEDSVTISWSGASGGTDNSIQEYYIQYITSSDNSTWGSWTSLAYYYTTIPNGSYNVSLSSKVTRGHYIKFRIRTQGTAGSSYYSDYKESSSIRRNPYTKCTAPTTFTAYPSDIFEDKITISWSGASGGTNNTISSYEIIYNISSNGSTWGSWETLTNYSTTSSKGSYTADMSSKVARGYYVRFQIRTQGTAGSSYYSDYKESSSTISIRRNPYTKCTAPTSITVSSEKALNGAVYNDIFESSITFSWSGAKAGENNSIVGYFIQYRRSDDGSTWGSWTDYSEKTTSGTAYTYTTTSIAETTGRGRYVQFRVQTLGAIDGYDSDYIVTNAMRKNSIPSNISSVSTNLPTLEYSYGDDIIISWKKPNDVDNNIYAYHIEMFRYYEADATDEEGWYSVAGITTDKTSYTLKANDFGYEYTENNQQIKFAVKAIDIFDVRSNAYTESPIITRYDITGVAIGVNGSWVNCQLFVGTNGQWIEQDVLSGQNGSWVESYDGT